MHRVIGSGEMEMNGMTQDCSTILAEKSRITERRKARYGRKVTELGGVL